MFIRCCLGAHLSRFHTVLQEGSESGVPSLPRAHGCEHRVQVPLEVSFGSEAAAWKSEVVGLGEPNQAEPPYLEQEAR